MTETVQINGDIVPVTAARPPKLNMTSAGAPAAMNTTWSQLTSRLMRGLSVPPWAAVACFCIAVPPRSEWTQAALLFFWRG